VRAFLASVALLLIVAGLSRASDDPWPALQKQFHDLFRFKGDDAREARTKAIGLLAASKDARAVPVLLDAYKQEDKYAEHLRADWAADEAAWKKIDDRLFPGYAAKAEAARQQGLESFPVSGEEADWFGSNKQAGKREEEKKRITRMYRGVLDEEETGRFVLRGVARVTSALEGTDHDKATAAFLGAAKAATSARRPDFVKALGFVKGEDVTALLEQFALDPNPDVVQIALESIGRQNSEHGLDVLIGRLEDPRWQVRAAAIEGLVFYRDPRAMDALLAGARKEDGVLQRNYFVAMARITQERIAGTIDAWESFWKANRDVLAAKWKGWVTGEPITDDPPDVPVDTNLGSTSFYGITTNSKHILFVVDVSGSMGLDKARTDAGRLPIDIEREELWNAIRSMSAEGDERGDSTFNVILFAQDVTVYEPGKMVPVTKKSKESVKKWIDDKVKALGSTNIYDALETAFNVISAGNEEKNLKKGADTLYFMTDGKPTRGKFLDTEMILREVKRMNETRKITIHTIGVGKDTDPDFLKKLAEQNRGQYIAR
jgi:HEAT repeat protein